MCRGRFNDSDGLTNRIYLQAEPQKVKCPRQAAGFKPMVKKSPLSGCVFWEEALEELLMRVTMEDQPLCTLHAPCLRVPCREIVACDFAFAQADVWIPDLRTARLCLSGITENDANTVIPDQCSSAARRSGIQMYFCRRLSKMVRLERGWALFRLVFLVPTSLSLRLISGSRIWPCSFAADRPE